MTGPAGGPAPPLTRVFAVLGAIALAAIAALHVVWTRSPWPLPTREAFVRTVMGEPSLKALPSAGATYAVAALVLSTAFIALARAGLARWPLPAWMLRLGAWVSGGVLALRGAGGLVLSLLAPQRTTPEFAWWNLWVYSPLALALGLVLLLNRRR